MQAITRSIQRDEYIMAQALYVAIRTMEAVEPDYHREPSNIEDMKLILATRFPSYQHLFDQQEKLRAANLAELGNRD